MEESGIWVRIVLDDSTEVTGFVKGVDSPNDFWTVFKTHMVHVEKVVETPPHGRKMGHETLYVNRDRILLANLLAGEP